MFFDSISQYGENYAILELNVDVSLNIIPIYFQDFIIMGKRFLQCDDYLDFIKPALQGIPYNTFEFDLKIAQLYGWMSDDIDDEGIPYLNKIIQAHTHKIELNDVIGVYPTIDYNEGIEYSLSASAKKLKNMIVR